MEEILREAFRQGLQFGIDAIEGKAPIGFAEWFKSEKTQVLISHSVSASKGKLLFHLKALTKEIEDSLSYGFEDVLEDYIKSNAL